MSEWVSISFSDAGVDFIDGDRGKNYPSQSDFSCKGDCLFLSTKNVRPNGFDFAETQFITYEKDKILRKGKLERGDIVLTTRGTVGNIAFYDEFVKYQNIRINSGMVIIRPNIKLIEAKFLLYFFRNFDFTTIISGSAQPQLPIRDLKQIDIKLPPLPEQQAIASVLSALDDKIDLLQRQNHTLEQMAATLFRQWFIEEAKEDWEAVKIGTLFKSGSGKSIKRSEISDNCNIPVLGANGLIGYTETALFNEDLIYTGRVGTLGKVTAIKSKPVWLSDNTIFFKNISYFYFTYFHLKQIDFQDYNSGSTQPLIRQSDINNIEIQIPSNLKMLNNFEEIVSPYFEKIDSNTQQVQTLQSLRDTLLPKLISGEVRLKGFETVS